MPDFSAAAPATPEPTSGERESAIAAICERTGKTREQAVAFLDVLGSALRRRGWVEGEPLSQAEIAERVDTFIGEARS